MISGFYRVMFHVFLIYCVLNVILIGMFIYQGSLLRATLSVLLVGVSFGMAYVCDVLAEKS